jgi:hypothetical protein
VGPLSTRPRHLRPQFAALVLVSVGIGALMLVAVLPAASSGMPGTLGTPSPRQSSSATITVAGLSAAKNISWAFWGLNVLATQPFGSADASEVAATPVTFLRFPGGGLGEELNYTSGVITDVPGGTQQATTTVAQFVTECKAIHCHAILQLPAEINSSGTAAYYASYVVHTLDFQPAYWEIGNAVPGWTHFGVPWSQWKTQQGKTSATPDEFAQLVRSYISAVRAVDTSAHFIALGVGMAQPNYAESWITPLASLDGPNLAGISVHSYIDGSTPPDPTWSELFSNLNGPYSLPQQVSAVRGFIKAACSTCTTNVYVTEANAAQDDSYVSLLSTFAGPLYLAADTAQALNLRLYALDWYCYDGNYSGAWEDTPGHWQMQYTLFSEVMTALKNRELATTVSGTSSLYAAATTASSLEALLIVNVNTTSGTSIAMDRAGLPVGSQVQMIQWLPGNSGPSTSTVTLGSTFTAPAESITVLSD